MAKKIAEYTTRDYTAVDRQLNEMSERESIITRRLRLKNLRKWLFLFLGILLGLGIFIILLSIAYRIAFSSAYFRIVEKPVIEIVEKIIERPVLQIVEKPVVQIVEKPVVQIVEKVIERIVEKPVVQIVEKVIERIVEKPIVEIVEKPVYISRPEYVIIKVPDASLSEVIEIPIYIEKIIKVPIQVGAVNDKFSFFHHEKINKNGVDSVTVGASYESVNSPYPEEQWCYAEGIKKLSANAWNRTDLGNKIGLASPTYTVISKKDATSFGASIANLERARKSCMWYPDHAPTSKIDNEEKKPIDNLPLNPPSSGGKSGTGFYINNKGYVVTNEHVVENCSSTWVNTGLNDFRAVVFRKDIDLDIAVLKIDNKTPNFAKFGQVRTGEDVMALGFPLSDKLGLEIKATKGNVSSLSGAGGDQDYLQFTAPIQPGNSGGPLLNEGGFVVGINTAALVGEKFQNINFAIKGSSASRFLGKHGIEFYYADYKEPVKSADIVEIAKKYTVSVLCYD